MLAGIRFKVLRKHASLGVLFLPPSLFVEIYNIDRQEDVCYCDAKDAANLGGFTRKVVPSSTAM
jgi:hypothetical protein